VLGQFPRANTVLWAVQIELLLQKLLTTGCSEINGVTCSSSGLKWAKSQNNATNDTEVNVLYSPVG